MRREPGEGDAHVGGSCRQGRGRGQKVNDHVMNPANTVDLCILTVDKYHGGVIAIANKTAIEGREGVELGMSDGIGRTSITINGKEITRSSCR